MSRAVVPLRDLALIVIGLQSRPFGTSALCQRCTTPDWVDSTRTGWCLLESPQARGLGLTCIGRLMTSPASSREAWDRGSGPQWRHKARLRDVSLSPGIDPKANEALAREMSEQLLRAIALGQWDQAEALATQAAATLRRLVTDQKSSAAAVPGLSRAELRLLPLLVTHLSYPEIGVELFLSANTIKSQAISIYRKLGVSLTQRGGPTPQETRPPRQMTSGRHPSSIVRDKSGRERPRRDWRADGGGVTCRPCPDGIANHPVRMISVT